MSFRNKNRETRIKNKINKSRLRIRERKNNGNDYMSREIRKQLIKWTIGYNGFVGFVIIRKSIIDDIKKVGYLDKSRYKLSCNW
jgi:hypothetical protein